MEIEELFSEKTDFGEKGKEKAVKFCRKAMKDPKTKTYIEAMGGLISEHGFELEVFGVRDKTLYAAYSRDVDEENPEVALPQSYKTGDYASLDLSVPGVPEASDRTERLPRWFVLEMKSFFDAKSHFSQYCAIAIPKKGDPKIGGKINLRGRPLKLSDVEKIFSSPF